MSLSPPVPFQMTNTLKENGYAPSGGLASIIEEFLRKYFEDHKGLLPPAGLYERVFQEVERPLLQITLHAVAGNQKKAAEILGINRNTLHKKLCLLGIHPQIEKP